MYERTYSRVGGVEWATLTMKGYFKHCIFVTLTIGQWGSNWIPTQRQLKFYYLANWPWSTPAFTVWLDHKLFSWTGEVEALTLWMLTKAVTCHVSCNSLVINFMKFIGLLPSTSYLGSKFSRAILGTNGEFGDKYCSCGIMSQSQK